MNKEFFNKNRHFDCSEAEWRNLRHMNRTNQLSEISPLRLTASVEMTLNYSATERKKSLILRKINF